MIEDYRSRTTDELIAERASLRKQYSYISQQAVGTKSYTKDLDRLERNLKEVNIVLNERGSAGTPGNFWGVPDFSNARF
jgi:hypothetical protein